LRLLKAALPKFRLKLQVRQPTLRDLRRSHHRVAVGAEALLPVLDLLGQSDASAEFPLAEFKKHMVTPPLQLIISFCDIR
jgi:hypothetical protein